jgi:hypothetical protein
VQDEATISADADRERRRVERARRRELEAARRARRRRVLPLAAAAVVAAAAVAGILLATGGRTHARRPAAHAVRRPETLPKRRSAAPAPRPRALLPARPTVTLIGDSVADEIAYLSSARALLAQGVRLRLEVAACRRLVAASCTVAGYRPPTALELVQAEGRALGQVAVVAVGYNDYEERFPGDVREVLAALRRAGVRQVLWLTLRANHHDYLAMNETLRALAAGRRDLTVVDWNVHSRSHPGWFKADGLHLTHAGALAMAEFLHRALAALPRRASP